MSAYPDGAEVFRWANIAGPYRWTLHRWWGPKGGSLFSPHANFVMLNPSTADGTVDDPTIVRCVGFARRLGFQGIRVVNLYALRATDPKELWVSEIDPTGGRRNDEMLALLGGAAAEQGEPLIAAWGANARPDRVEQVLTMRGFDRLTCLGVTSKGAPRHPLYLHRDSPLVPWPEVAA